MNIVPVILAGGIGERFWPLSRSSRPKQLLPLISRRSMLEETLARTAKVTGPTARPLIVTGRSLAPRIRTVLGRRNKCDYICEVEGKNTAPAVALAAAWLEKKYGPVIMLVLSADHAITPYNEFVRAVNVAAHRAETDKSLVVFGIQPSRPDTGYGYIEIDGTADFEATVSSHKVKKFVEKPNWKNAVAFSQSGRHFWNSGMFVWRTDVILEQFKTFAPQIYRHVHKAQAAGFARAAIDTFYGAVPKESVDYAIMEKAHDVVMVAGRFLWDDVGSWESVGRIHPGNAFHTSVTGKRIYESGCKDSIIVNNSLRTVAAIGLENIVLVTTEDAVLALPRSELPNIKTHLAALKTRRDIPAKLF